MSHESAQQERSVASAGPAAVTEGASTTLRPATSSSITGGFWRARQDTNGSVAIIEGYDRLTEAGNLANLRIAAGIEDGAVRGPVFMDSDIYKWLEAVAWEYARNPDPRLLELQREVTALVARAQAEDGYLDSVVQVRDNGERYRNLIHSHELYCAGHLFQAAVAQARSTPDRGLLDVAIKLADHLVRTFGEGKTVDIDGHPIVEMALVELYRETGTRAYLELAEFFVEARGHGIIPEEKDPTYFSDRLPVRDAESFEGHAVRAVYLAAGVADVALETGDASLLAAVERQFARTWERKTYITGALGARWEGEAFGDEYELPSDRAYAETCAAIGGVQLAWRLLLATGSSRYADAIERQLYNGFLPGVSLGGNEYFYVNALQLRTGADADSDRSPAHGRRAWFDVACCPPNIMRTFASLDKYVATGDADGLQLQQFVTGRFAAATASGTVGISVETDYPHSGAVGIKVSETVAGPWTLSVRVPGWAKDVTAEVAADGAAATAAGTIDGGYLRISREWAVGDTVDVRVPFTPRVLAPDVRIDAVRQSVAIERGPLVYCAEEIGQDRIDDFVVAPREEIRADWEPGLLGGVTVLDVQGRRVPPPTQGSGELPYYDLASDDQGAQGDESASVSLVPYYAWGNRGVEPMRVWLRV